MDISKNKRRQHKCHSVCFLQVAELTGKYMAEAWRILLHATEGHAKFPDLTKELARQHIDFWSIHAPAHGSTDPDNEKPESSTSSSKSDAEEDTEMRPAGPPPLLPAPVLLQVPWAQQRCQGQFNLPLGGFESSERTSR